jgi:hypothetical protein
MNSTFNNNNSFWDAGFQLYMFSTSDTEVDDDWSTNKKNNATQSLCYVKKACCVKSVRETPISK